MAFLHSYGVKVVLHSCGYTMPALPLIVDAGFDGINPLEVAAGNDIFTAAEKYGDRLVFVGGFDKRILGAHDHDLIRSEVARVHAGNEVAGRPIPVRSDHSISTNTDYADYQCAMEVYREHRML